MAGPIPLGAGAAQLVELLESAGITAYLDPRDLEPPCAWVAPGTISTAGGLALDELEVAWRVYLIASGGLDVPGQLDELGRLLPLALGVLGPVDAEPVGVSLPNLAPDPLPGLQLTVDTTLTSQES